MNNSKKGHFSAENCIFALVKMNFYRIEHTALSIRKLKLSQGKWQKYIQNSRKRFAR